MDAKRLLVLLLGLAWGVNSSPAAGQITSDLQTFGYFQNQFFHQTETFPELDLDLDNNTFLTQQLNLFLQKDLGPKWRAFVNFEVVNSFSSSRRWGAFNLEEAWGRYSTGSRFNLKLGLQIPTFNNLNEIKNRTPLLPYILRPLVYETSLADLVGNEEFVPHRAFVQLYGTILGRAKFDYALFLGNSPNVRTVLDNERADQVNQTGIDTTATLLVGGRVGVRSGGLKAGFSATLDYYNGAKGIEEIVGGTPTSFEEVPRVRLGWDLSYNGSKLLVEGEAIVVRYRDSSDLVSVEREFIYGTLGYYITEPLLFYVSYWYMDNRAFIGEIRDIVEVFAPNFGLAYTLENGITFKAQYVHADLDTEAFEPDVVDYAGTDTINHYSVAISFIF